MKANQPKHQQLFNQSQPQLDCAVTGSLHSHKLAGHWLHSQGPQSKGDYHATICTAKGSDKLARFLALLDQCWTSHHPVSLILCWLNVTEFLVSKSDEVYWALTEQVPSIHIAAAKHERFPAFHSLHGIQSHSMIESLISWIYQVIKVQNQCYSYEKAILFTHTHCAYLSMH